MASERQLLLENDPWWGEHVHRYHVIIPLVQSRDLILDIACGTGFGSDILAAHTQNMVIGGDISADAVADCKSNWKRTNLQFEVLDGTRLPYGDAHFDKIVSFETIEHTTAYRQMLEEFCRVLKKDGLAFISTPNFPVNSPSGKVTNPYHTQEFTYDELKELLESIFDQVEITGQKYSRYDDGKVSGFGKIIEWVFGIIGIRKLPYEIKNAASKFFIKKTFYPASDDFSMVSEKHELLQCKTFFCVCRKLQD